MAEQPGAPLQPPQPDPAPRPLAGGAAMSAVARTTAAVAGALTAIVVARTMGPDGAGGFAIALTLVVALTSLTTFGVEHGIAYYVSSGRWPAADALAACRRVALAAGLLAAVAGLGARLLMPSAFAGLSVASTIVVVAAMPFALWWFYVTYVALALDRYEAYVLPLTLQSVGLLVLVVPLSIAADLPGAVVALTASQVIAALAAAWWARRVRPDDRKPEPRQLRRAVSFGVKGYAANALALLSMRIDLFILSAAASAAAVGQLSVAFAVTTVMWLLPQALSDVVFPRVAALSAARGDPSFAHRTLVETKSLRHATLVMALAAGALAIALVVLVVPVFGPQFAPATTLGLILLPGVALYGLGQILSAIIVGRGHPIYSLYNALIVTPLTIALYLVLIPSMQAEGAALVKSGSLALSFLIALFFYRRVTGAQTKRLLVPTADELRDLRALVPLVREWASGVYLRMRARGT
ncbi:MAG: oligosaccharide flippase family protein [Actinobacteria bacterium]|nr:oligosaccharide flippase family protein [Actinomycetota bacterium]